MGVKQKMLSHLALFSWMTIATSGSVPGLLLLSNFARQEQARHTADYQTTPVCFLWQLPHDLLSCIFAEKGCGRWWQPRGQCQCELEDKSGHRWTQCKDGKLSSISGG